MEQLNHNLLNKLFKMINSFRQNLYHKFQKEELRLLMLKAEVLYLVLQMQQKTI